MVNTGKTHQSGPPTWRTVNQGSRVRTHTIYLFVYLFKVSLKLSLKSNKFVFKKICQLNFLTQKQNFSEDRDEYARNKENYSPEIGGILSPVKVSVVQITNIAATK